MFIDENKEFTMCGYKMRIIFDHYAIDGSPAITLECFEDGCWQTFNTITVWIKHNMEPSVVYLDANNCQEYWEEIIALFKDNNLGTFTGRKENSGFCMYPEVVLNLEKLFEVAYSTQ